MLARVTEQKLGGDFRKAVRAFYNLHPYPPPLVGIDDNRLHYQDENHRRADFHLLWPFLGCQDDLRILVAGCGTSQAARYALRRPSPHVIGIDLSGASIFHTLALKQNANCLTWRFTGSVGTHG